MDNFASEPQEYCLSQEYKDYCNSLIQDHYFLYKMQTAKDEAYGDLYPYIDSKKIYLRGSILLHILSGILICAGFWSLLHSEQNLIASLLCAMCYLCTLLCLFISHKLSEKHKLVVARRAFNDYTYKQELLKRIAEDQANEVYIIQQKLSGIEHSKRSIQSLDDLRFYFDEYKKLTIEYRNILHKYEKIKKIITTDFSFWCEINSKMK